MTSALYASGYGSSSRFYAQARSALGMTPTSYKRGGEGMTMNYATADSPIGQILVAATERGICAVSIGEDDCRARAVADRRVSPGDDPAR